MDKPFDIDQVTTAQVAKMFFNTPVVNIQAHLSVVLAALKRAGLTEKAMVLMALATIRAETEGFVPISEGRSRFNTVPNGRLFGLYDGRETLGNTEPGDGERYRGRGFVQLTGRANYEQIGQAIGIDLEGSPELANDPAIAAAILASFLKRKEAKIREALASRALIQARRLVNGGTHGFDRFIEAYQIGEQVL